MNTGKNYLERIESSPDVCGGVPCVRGTRIQVSVVLSHLAAGDTTEIILRNFPQITKDDLQACLEFAAFLSTEKLLPV